MPVYLRVGALSSQKSVGFPEAGIATGCELSNTGAGTEFELSRKAVGALNF